jgi:hypothetical protein
MIRWPTIIGQCSCMNIFPQTSPARALFAYLIQAIGRVASFKELCEAIGNVTSEVM